MLNRTSYGTLLLLMVLSLSAPAFAQLCEGPVVANGPVKLVHGELTLPSGDLMQFSVREGELLLVRGLLDSPADTLALQLSGDEASGFSIRRFAASSVGTNPPEFLDREGLRVRARVAEVTALGDLSIKIFGTDWRTKETEPMSPATPRNGEEILRNVAAGGCCVTCGSVTACGCAVSHSCGSCCSDPCCGGGGGGPIEEKEKIPQ